LKNCILLLFIIFYLTSAFLKAENNLIIVVNDSSIVDFQHKFDSNKNLLKIEDDTCGCTDLYQTYPNPTDDITTFGFYIGEEMVVSLIIFDLQGNQVEVLINNEKFSKGVSYRTFSLKSLPIGIYEYQLITPNGVKVKKLIIAR
jgi:hypothetical protein